MRVDFWIFGPHQQKISSQKSKVDGGRGNKYFRFHRFFYNLVEGPPAKFVVDISKTVGGDRFPVKLYFFQRILATVRIFKISLIDSQFDAHESVITVFGFFKFSKKFVLMGVVGGFLYRNFISKPIFCVSSFNIM